MDQELAGTAPPGSTRRRGTRRASSPAVVVGGRLLPIVTLGPSGFVIAAEHAARLPGFVDIVVGSELIDRRLVVCAWARDGLVGFEYKCSPAPRPPAVDYVVPSEADGG